MFGPTAMPEGTAMLFLESFLDFAVSEFHGNETLRRRNSLG
jgi:hypothetical protein